MEKTLKYSIHVYGELESAIECPLGTYYVDLGNKVFFFKCIEDTMPYHATVQAAKIVASIAVSAHVESAIPAFVIHKKCALLDKEDVHEKYGKLVYDYQIEGEMDKYVNSKIGSLYADKENEVFYFDSAKKGFMEPILKKRFCTGVKADLNSDDVEKQFGAKFIMNIIENWTELDDEDIVRGDSSN